MVVTSKYKIIMNFKQTLLTLLLGFNLFSTLSYSQEKKLVDFLNKSLTKEIKNQIKSPEFSGDTISVIQPYKINEEKILSLVIKKYQSYSGEYHVIKQEVPLSRIRQIIKDINVIFLTESNDVAIMTTINGDEATMSTGTSDLFFTQFYLDKNNKNFGKTLEKYFKGAHYDVTMDIWAD